MNTLLLKQVLLLPGFSRRAVCRTVQCHHATVDGNNINLTFILTLTGTAIVKSVIRWWRKEMIGRRGRFLDPVRHFWLRFGRISSGRVGWRSCRTLRATAFRAADNQEECDQATEWSHIPYQRPWIHHPLVFWKKENRCQVSVQVSTQWKKASGK